MLYIATDQFWMGIKLMEHFKNLSYWKKKYSRPNTHVRLKQYSILTRSMTGSGTQRQSECKHLFPIVNNIVQHCSGEQC
jgi:hypothetical protein